MNWFIRAFTSSVGRKVIMSLTGLFLCLFLVVHISGNFQLFKDDGGFAFNSYTHFMTHNPVIKTISYLLYATIILHAIQALLITLKNKSARPQGYVNNQPKANSAWSSRNMGLLGTILLLFLIIHFKDFWAQYKFGDIKMRSYVEYVQSGENKVALSVEEFQKIYQAEQTKAMATPGFEPTITDAKKVQYKDLYALVAEEFKELWVVIFYLISMVALSFHLVHGFTSSWQSIGFSHKKYKALISGLGWIFSVVIPAGFAAMPLYFLLK